MALISSFFSCFGPTSNSSSEVYDNAENSFQEKPKRKEKSNGAPIVVSYFSVNNCLSRF